MRSPRGKRILTALMVAGGLAGLLAIILLPGRWFDGSAEAHITAGVEIIDTATLVTSHGVDAAGAVDDANPGTALLVDTNGDTVPDAIAVAAGTTVRVVAHAHTGAANAPDNTNVTFTATGSAVFQARSVDLAAPAGALDNAGLLTAVTDTQTVIAQVVRDIDADNVGDACTVAADTCIDGLGDGDADGAPLGTDDGIAIVEARSGLPTRSTVTAATAAGTDSVTIIWTGAVTAIAVTSTLDDATDPNKLVAQTVIAQSGLASNEKAAAGLNGDPDVTITARATDSAGNPVSAVNVDCTLDTTGGGRADIAGTGAGNDEVADDAAADPGGNSALDGATGATGLVQRYLESENEAGNTRGNVIVTCWADSVTENDLITTGEPSATVTVRVSGPPAAVALQGSSTMTVGTQTLKAVVTDADGQAVATGTNCTWLDIDPLNIAALILASPVASAGNSNSNIFVAGAAGTVTVSVTCGTATALISITIAGALATNTPTTAPTVTPGGPTLTPVPPTATATLATPTGVPPTATPTGVPATNTPTRTRTPVPPTATTPAKACGDANDDGEVNSVDASLILQLVAGLIDALPNPDARPDVNGDGAVTSVDAVLILQLNGGLIGSGDLNCP